VGFSVIIVCGR